MKDKSNISNRFHIICLCLLHAPFKLNTLLSEKVLTTITPKSVNQNSLSLGKQLY